MSGENENVKYLKCFINNEMLYDTLANKKIRRTNIWDVIKYLTLLSNLHRWNLHYGNGVY